MWKDNKGQVMNTIRFTSAKKISEDILEGMRLTQKEMSEKGLWNENTTFEDWARYAGENVRITEQPERLNPETAKADAIV